MKRKEAPTENLASQKKTGSGSKVAGKAPDDVPKDKAKKRQKVKDGGTLNSYCQ